VPITVEELVGYIIDGIPDRALRNEAQVSGAATREALMARFEQIEPLKKKETKSGEEKYQSRSRDKGGEGGTSKLRRDRDSEEASRRRETTSIANCPIMSVETVQ